jgi:poly-gamma-glutamate synthesis protein (capsule biosynthesis protein)
VIAAVGDIMLGGSGGETYRTEGYFYPFAETAAILSGSDLAIGNLEAPLTRGGVEFSSKRFRFRAAPEAAQSLKEAGFSALSLANNHILDYGAAGLRETMAQLDRAGIVHVGAGEDLRQARQGVILTVKGKKVALFSYSLVFPREFFATAKSAGTAPGYPPLIIRDIATVRSRVDYVIVSMHWGTEMATRPTAYQVATAHALVDAGADLVIGHHPHVLQGAERYKEGVILYSLGNFTFGSLSAGASRSAIARIVLDRGVKEVEWFPLNVLNREVRFQPRLLSGRARQKAAADFARISAPWGTTVVDAGGRYLLQFGEPYRRLGQR